MSILGDSLIDMKTEFSKNSLAVSAVYSRQCRRLTVKTRFNNETLSGTFLLVEVEHSGWNCRDDSLTTDGTSSSPPASKALIR